MTYTLKLSRREIVSLYAVSFFFIIFAFFSLQQNIFVALSCLILFALPIGIYAANKSRTRVTFDPDQPPLTIKSGFGKIITIQPSDCTKLSTTMSYVTLPKLTYRINGKTKYIVLYNSDFESDKAWYNYSKKWLEAIKTDKVKQNDIEYEHILASPTEDYYNEHFGNKKDGD